jgi:molybdopterin molybdotransferase
MAQLTNDCFAFGGELMSIEAARALIVERLAPVAGSEVLALDEADGRVLAEDLVAPLDLPPFANSAVDGYAVRFADLKPTGETVLPVHGRLAAGASPSQPRAGAAVRIFTGAPMPDGFDTVFMQEDVRIDDAARVVLPAGLKAGANRRLSGEDLRKGARALPAGKSLNPQDIALLAALGIAAVPVRRALRVAVFSTGDEIAPPGEPLAAAKVYDSNRFMLRALLRRLACEVTDLGILRDDRAAVSRALSAAAGHDLIVTSGGVSTGEEDHVKAAVESIGGLSFWRLAIKPGRPVAMGVVGGTPFVGLPGNPVAVFVTFAHVARAMIARLSGETFDPPKPVAVRSAFSYRKKEGRREYVRVRLTNGAAGVEAQKHLREGAGILTSLTETDGLVELPETVTRVEPGDTVGFLPYALLR